MNILLKNVDEEKYRLLKIEAAKRRVTLGKLFNMMVEQHTAKEKEALQRWDKIFSTKPFLSNEDVKGMRERIKMFRQEYGFEG